MTPLATLFVHPMQIPPNWAIWMMLPLCASVAVVYKAVRVGRLRDLPKDIASLFFIYMVGGLVLLAGLLWLIVRIFLEG